VRAFRFPVHPTLDEQKQLAAVMKASKATIAALVNRQAALSDLKKSLMHDLLIGRIRVREMSTVDAS
jgi:type I restriction enzyme S subunit